MKIISIYLSLILYIMDFLLVFLELCLILGGLGVVVLTNPIYSTFSLSLVLIYISLFYILSNLKIYNKISVLARIDICKGVCRSVTSAVVVPLDRVATPN
ncbi:hypothetical protein E1A91_D05G315100v1 [Gossypium mustelinum]|uniref:Uncharacterized protein n=1 Tax=Gossypium mustelinum TaxID=34275 RepID=A0A5D2V328_GOSMU|nr:hypothetical protein E1A91_D05G315100v1 [Gossypium mustelinum]